MRAVFGFVGILLVLGIGWIVYSIQLKSGPEGALLPQQSNLIAVRQDLLSLGQAEKLYNATNGQYTTIDQLSSSGVVHRVPEGRRWGYEYRIESLDPGHFVITATPLNPGPGNPVLSVDETLRISP
jgi:hypothetical protein